MILWIFIKKIKSLGVAASILTSFGLGYYVKKMTIAIPKISYET